MPTRLISKSDSLEEIVGLAWRLLAGGAARAGSPLHTAVLGTRDAAASCAIRTVVLRRVVPERRLLLCHTDRRSPKVDQIANSLALDWLFYDPAHKLQLRLSGPGRVLESNDPLTEQQWRRSRTGSRRCYLAPLAPGTVSNSPESGFPSGFRTRKPDREQSEAGRSNFAVVAGEVTFLDVLQLGARGHLRAQFSWSGESSEATWVAP